MAKFKVGDKVKRVADSHESIMLINTEWIVSEIIANSLWIKVEGYNQVLDSCKFELVGEKTHLPLFSEETAISFLKEKGYVVTPPPPKLSGVTYIYRTSAGNIYGYPTKLELDWPLLAILSWTEGDGLTESPAEPDGRF